MKLNNKELEEILTIAEQCKVLIPKLSYNEELTKKIFYCMKDKKKLEKDDILIIEGLHAINEELTKTIPRINKYKVYLSALTDLNIDDQNMISTSDLRLMRRIVRDNRTRNYTALDTIKAWKNVRSGEEKYIFPYRRKRYS